MPLDDLKDALDGLIAYDTGSIDSGIHDEALRDRCIEALQELDDKQLTRLIRDMWVSEKAIAQGYTYEDLLSFCRWLGDYMEMDLL